MEDWYLADLVALPTYVSAIGSSIVDLVWCRLSGIPHIIDLKINYFCFGSNHLYPVSHVLDDTLFMEPAYPKEAPAISLEKFKWDIKNELDYKQLITQQLENSGINMECAFTNEINKFLLKSIKYTANILNMKYNINSKPCFKNYSRKTFRPWFDRDCYVAKKESRAARKCRSNLYNESFKSQLTTKLKMYKKILTLKNGIYKSNLIKKLSHIKNSKQVWCAINSLKKKNNRNNSCVIPLNECELYYKNLHTWPTKVYDMELRGSIHSDLDKILHSKL